MVEVDHHPYSYMNGIAGDILYKVDNLNRAHRDTVLLENISGWGLDEGSLRNRESWVGGKRHLSFLPLI